MRHFPLRKFAVQHCLVCVLAPLFGLLSLSNTFGDEQATQPKTNWYTDLDEAAAESKRTGKPILMEINGRPWCPPCNVQGKEVIDHADFQAWARDTVVLLDVKVGKGYDKDKGNPIWLQQLKKHRLPGIPAAVILDQNGESMGVVFPKDNVQQWIGAASNIITSHGLKTSSSHDSPQKQEQTQTQTQSQVLPFRLTKWNNISVPVTLNRSVALNLMFHTAVDSVSLTQEATERFPEITFNQEVDMNTWGGQSKSRVGTGHILEIAGLEPQEVNVFEGLHSGHGTDGKFGPEQLGSRLWALDFEQSEIRLLSEYPEDLSAWHKLAFETERGMMFVTATVHGERTSATQKFMLHSGYSGFALLDDAFAAQHPFLANLEILEESELTDSAGNKLATKKIKLPKFTVGEFEFESSPVSFFSGGVGHQKFSVLGGDFLKRFNFIFDLDAKCLYMTPSSHSKAEFFQAD